MRDVEAGEAIGEAIHAELLDYLANLPQRLEASDSAKAADATWIASASLIRTLSATQRSQLTVLLRHVAVDSVSSALAILDGTSVPEDLPIEATVASNPYVLDAFLVADEVERG